MAKTKKKLLYSKFFVIFLIIVLILVAVALLQESYKYFKVSQEIKNLEERIEDLKKSNEELTDMEKYFESEDFLEEQARLKLNLTKPGEKLIIVKTLDGFGQEQEGQGLAKEVSNIKLWWKYFFERR